MAIDKFGQISDDSAMKKMIFSVLAVLTLMVGCESTSYYSRVKVEMVGSPAAKKPYGTVEFFQSKEKVTASYDVIARMSVEGGASTESALIKAFQDQAADIGADGVILYRPDGGSSSGGVYRDEAIHFK